ncbi:MAG TPA: 50S ribosomal protein L29 [Candidatus Moranbacteria bacterium]|nr:50S ribosomal protein L29 [Candidatus Moranbacteria bacterium]
MKIKELREKGIAELRKLLAEKRENTRKVRFDVASKQVKNNRELRNDKKDIARILTLINEKQDGKQGN